MEPVEEMPQTGARRRSPPETPMTVSNEALLVDGSDLEFRRFVHRLLAFAARLESVRSGFAAMIGLTGIQYTTLISIAHLQWEGGVGVTRIAEDLGLSGSFVTLVSGQLVKLGLVDKKVSEDDRRRVRLTVTSKGLELLSDLAPVQREVNDLLFRPLDGGRFAMLSRLLEELVRSGDESVALVEYLAGNPQLASPMARDRLP
jgi:DNA-binding MarR family transcriptional regulator